MNTKEIEYLWKQATNCPHHDTNWHDPVIVKFAELVIAAEREACAKVCLEEAPSLDGQLCAAAIRARGNP
jgi:hypothetical protein